jgi:tight adherence protein B
MTAACTLVAAVLCGGAVYLRRPDDWLMLRVRFGVAVAGPGRQWPAGRFRVGLAVAATAAVTLTVPDAPTQVALVAGVLVAVFAAALRRQARVRKRAVAFRADIARMLASTAAELRGGVDPIAAVHAAVGDLPVAQWGPVQTAAAADIEDALWTVSTRPGGEALAEVAAAWHIADQTGSPLSIVLGRMAESVRAEVELDRDVAVEAAPARATARLMAVLPVAGLGLGLLLGVNPIRILVTTGVGAACLVTGLALACLGVWRIERIVTAAELR